VSYGTGITELFVRLGQTGSLETALTDGVRLACEATGCVAGTVVADADAAWPPSSWFRHDPHGLLERVAGNDGVPESPTRAGRGRNGVLRCARGSLREVQVPLRCAGREVGRLILLAPHDASPEELKVQTSGIGVVLAVLMAAAENSAARPISGVLGHQAFRARVVSELSRSERCDDRLSVLHLRFAGVHGSNSEEVKGPWARVAALGEALASRLRASDVIGMLAPDHLAVLLTGTGRLGARIAARRIEQLLQMPDSDSGNGLNPRLGAAEFCLRTYPDDGGDVDSLCRVQHWSSAAMVPPAAAVNAV